MAKDARAQYGDVPLVGMGHLTAMDEHYDIGEFPRLVHMIIKNGLDGHVFGDDYCYVALGHIHRKYKVRGNANAWYCGSVIPCSISEAEDGSRRGVWVFELSGDKNERPQPKEVLAPCFRKLIRWTGSDKEVEAFLTELCWEEDLSPIVYLEVETQSALALDKQVNSVLESLDPKPHVVEIKSKIAQSRQLSKSSEHRVTDPDVLTRPIDLFKDFHRYKEGVDADEKDVALFASLIHQGRGEDE